MGRVHVCALTEFTYSGRQNDSTQLVNCGKKMLSIKIVEYLK
jgi:hypothetical protein